MGLFKGMDAKLLQTALTSALLFPIRIILVRILTRSLRIKS
jgi:hypothetical protein